MLLEKLNAKRHMAIVLKFANIQGFMAIVSITLSHNRHPVDGALVGAGSLWPRFSHFGTWSQYLRVRVGYI